jgi:hypothetical protein
MTFRNIGALFAWEAILEQVPSTLQHLSAVRFNSDEDLVTKTILAFLICARCTRVAFAARSLLACHERLCCKRRGLHIRMISAKMVCKRWRGGLRSKEGCEMRARAVHSLSRLSCDFRELADYCYGPMRLPLDAIQEIARPKNGVYANAMLSMLCSLYDEKKRGDRGE